MKTMSAIDRSEMNIAKHLLFEKMREEEAWLRESIIEDMRENRFEFGGTMAQLVESCMARGYKIVEVIGDAEYHPKLCVFCGSRLVAQRDQPIYK